MVEAQSDGAVIQAKCQEQGLPGTHLYESISCVVAASGISRPGKHGLGQTASIATPVVKTNVA